MQTQVKMCGLRKEQEFQLAAQLGVKAIGMVLYPKSKRALSLEQAKQLRAFVPDVVDLIVLMVNPSEQEVQAVIDQLAPTAIQFHGDETAKFCEQFHYPYWRAVRVGAPGLVTTEELQQYIQQYPHATRFLFDAYSASYGGSGLRFDLNVLSGLKLPHDKQVIAGGINEHNVQELLGKYDFIDLSSGIEEQAGVKSLDKMRSFMAKVHHVSKS